jgi:hypothetical protein
MDVKHLQKFGVEFYCGKCFRCINNNWLDPCAKQKVIIYCAKQKFIWRVQYWIFEKLSNSWKKSTKSFSWKKRALHINSGEIGFRVKRLKLNKSRQIKLVKNNNNINLVYKTNDSQEIISDYKIHFNESLNIQKTKQNAIKWCESMNFFVDPKYKI